MAGSLVLLPTYNERANLLRVVPRLGALEDEVDVLVIDDASPDGTGEVAEELGLRYPRLSVLHRRRKEGLGRAYVHGLKEALRRGYSRVVTMDADLSHAPEDVPRLLRALEKADVAIGSRHTAGGAVEDWPVGRRLLSWLGSLYARSLLGLQVRDVTSGFRAYRCDALRALDLGLVRSRGFIFQVEILRRILDLPGACATEVPIVFRDRAEGSSKLTRQIIVEAVVEVAALAFRRRRLPKRPYRPRETAELRAPRVTVVVPARPEVGEPEALAPLSGLRYPREKLEVVVARGRSPARQRNLAVRSSAGEFILFLDDDSTVAEHLLHVYLTAFRRDPTLAAVGGPAEALPGSRFQELAALVLSEPWVMGKSASRYRARGERRFTDERELILCNLCVRRRAFEDAGGFNESLYPNEENELLERLRRSGWRLLYLPEAKVLRPQREGLGEFLEAIHHYGKGRGAQWRALPSRTSLVRIAGVLLAVAGFALAMAAGAGAKGALALPLALYGVYLTFLSARLASRAGFWRGGVAALLAALLHGAYAAGVLRGLLSPIGMRADSHVALECSEIPQNPEARERVL